MRIWVVGLGTVGQWLLRALDGRVSAQRLEATPGQVQRLVADWLSRLDDEQAAAALAERVLREAPPNDEARLDYAWRMLYARLPRPAERQATLKFLADTISAQPGNDALRTAWTQAALVLLNSNEFLYVH